MFVRALGFLRLSLTFPMEARAVALKALCGPRLRLCRDCFHSLSDRPSYERYKGAGKTCKLDM